MRAVFPAVLAGAILLLSANAAFTASPDSAGGEVVILRAPIFYQAERMEKLVATHEPTGLSQADRQQRAVVQDYIKGDSIGDNTGNFSLRVISDTDPDPRADTADSADLGGLCTGRAELIGPPLVLGRALLVIDELDRPDPIIDLDVLIFRISGNGDQVDAKEKELLRHVNAAQSIGDSLNILGMHSPLPNFVPPSLASFIRGEASDPIRISVSDRNEIEYQVRPWTELSALADFRRRIELRSLMIALAETKAVKDSQAKGHIMQRVLMQQPFVPSELVTAASFSLCMEDVRPPQKSDFVQGMHVEYDAEGRLLKEPEKLQAWIQFSSLDAFLIAGFLGLDLRYEDALDDVRKHLCKNRDSEVQITVTKPEYLDRILRFGQLRESPVDAAPEHGRSMIFDEKILKFSSQLTLQLRAAHTQTFSACAVSSDLHEFGAGDLQRVSEAIANYKGEVARQDILNKLANVMQKGRGVVVKEDLKVDVKASASDLTSAHYYPSRWGPDAGVPPTLSQSAFGSIAIKVRSDMQLSGMLRDAETPTVAVTQPLKLLDYNTVVDSTSYRPNLVLATSFRRELRSRPGVVPALLSVGGVLTAVSESNWSPLIRFPLFLLGMEGIKGTKTNTTQTIALVVTPRPRTALPAQELIDAELDELQELNLPRLQALEEEARRAHIPRAPRAQRDALSVLEVQRIRSLESPSDRIAELQRLLESDPTAIGTQQLEDFVAGEIAALQAEDPEKLRADHLDALRSLIRDYVIPRRTQR